MRINKKSKRATIAPVNHDAKMFSKMYDDETLFQICAMCGSEGARNTCVSIESCQDELNASGIKELFVERIESLNDELSTTYDKVFSIQLQKHFTNGLLNGVTKICRLCFKQLPSSKKKANQPIVSSVTSMHLPGEMFMV